MSTWIETFKGHKFDVFNIDPKCIDIEDIAHSLAMACRFNGHLKKFVSVAEHSIAVATTVSEENAFCGLMHDAAEAYITDVPKPIKVMLPEINKLDAIITEAVFKKYGISYPIADEVKAVDREMCYAEAKDSGMDVKSWDIQGYVDALDYTPYHWSPVEAKTMFLAAFRNLYKGSDY